MLAVLFENVSSETKVMFCNAETEEGSNFEDMQRDNVDRKLKGFIWEGHIVNKCTMQV